ncbi:MAG: hypothetical protein PHW33_01325 [Candidatus Portnoybacteria bacterium]|jgi:hypothetical protein|nr:hypothetical protein [Candidatus Portnoybacteria bacterium]
MAKSKYRFFIETYDGKRTDDTIRENLNQLNLPVSAELIVYQDRKISTYEVPPDFIDRLNGAKTAEKLRFRTYMMTPLGTVQRWRMAERVIRKKAKYARRLKIPGGKQKGA